MYACPEVQERRHRKPIKITLQFAIVKRPCYTSRVWIIDKIRVISTETRRSWFSQQRQAENFDEWECDGGAVAICLRKRCRVRVAREFISLKPCGIIREKGGGGRVKGAETAFHGRSHHENPVMTRKRADLRGKPAPPPFATGLRAATPGARDKKLYHTRYFINYDLPLLFFVDATFQKIKTWSKGGKNLIFFLAFLMKYRPLPSGVMQRRRCKFRGEDRKRRGAAAAPAEETF